MTDVLTWWENLSLSPTVLPVSLVCALCGAFILSLFTRWKGFSPFVFNTAALFVGAYFANVLAVGFTLSLERLYARPIVVSFFGMTVIAVLLLLGTTRSGTNE